MSEGERRLAAIMFTDVVGFTSLGQVNEDLALRLLEEHRGIIRPLIAKRNGIEVKTIGDAFLVEFASALEAVKCAVEIQDAMHQRNLSEQENRRIQMRIGIHVGEVVHSQGDILGDAVNVSSRIEPLANPGGVCVSGQAYDHVRNKVEWRMEPLGGKTLKNVSLPLDVYRIVMPWESGNEAAGELDARRVAVLPLKNMSPDPNDEYFADGMTEELITALSSVNGLTVIARTSVMQYKAAPKRVVDVGRELSVGTVVEGSVRKAGMKVRITVQLIDARNEGHLWAQNYDKQLDDVFTVQSEVAEKVAEALKVKLADSARERIERGAEVDSQARNLYLQGLFYWDKRSPEGLRKAVEFFEQAVKLDPNFAKGHAGMAQAFNVIAGNNMGDPKVYFPKAKEYALKALSLDGDLAEAHTVLAKVMSDFERDFDGSEREFKKAIELNPGYATAHQWYSQLLGFENRMTESWSEINKALDLSPLSLIINTNIADACYYRKDFGAGIGQGKKIIDMDPNFASIYPTLVNNYIGAGMFDEAVAAADSYAKMDGVGAEGLLVRASARARAGRSEEARKLLAQVETAYSRKYASPFLIGLVHFALRENDKGFEWWEKAYEARDRWILLMGISQIPGGVRSDPRYLEILQKVGLAGRVRP